MTIQNIALFHALGSKMDYLDFNQRIISQNVANADTPGHVPQEVKPVDFGRYLSHITKDNTVRTDTTHMRHMPDYNEIDDPKDKSQKQTYEVAPAGNAVSLEEQVIKSSRNVMDYNLMTKLYQKHITMMHTALGKGR